MLAAIVPHGERAWFLKVVGPSAAVDDHAESVLEFFASVRFSDDQPRPSWQLPDGWTESEGTGMRVATITIPAASEALELTVIALPWSGGPDEVLSNVNRWRGQMKLPPVDQAGLADCTREISVAGANVTVVDLQGAWKDTGMSAPFAGAPFAGNSPALPPGHPTASASSGSPIAKPQFEVPDSWEESPSRPPRRATYRVTGGSQEALVTVIDFPASAGPMIADPLANLNRWRGEIGLQAVPQDALESVVETIEIAGQPGQFFRVVPDPTQDSESQVEEATLAAMVTLGDRIWFFKMMGNRDLVVSQQDPFKSFLQSAEIDADGGAANGH